MYSFKFLKKCLGNLGVIKYHQVLNVCHRRFRREPVGGDQRRPGRRRGHEGALELGHERGLSMLTGACLGDLPEFPAGIAPLRAWRGTAVGFVEGRQGA